VPLRYAETPFPSVPLDAPVRAELDLPDFPVSGLTAFTDVIGRAGGRLGARLRLTGTLQAPQPSGSIELKDAALSIAAIAQPFSHVNGRIELAPDKVVIRELKARDRGGKLGIGGYAQYNVMRGGKVELHVSAEAFPVRQQGSIVGELTTRATLTGKVDASNKLALTLSIRGGRIWLTGEGGQQVQELDEHPDIRFDTEPVIKAVTVDEEEQETAMTLALFRIRTDEDLWLMHKDFAVQVSVDMKLTTDADGATMQGQAGITRGRVNLLGKPFEIQKGAIRFTGDVPPDPELDLKAKHTTHQGKELLVQIVGRASAPQILFSGAANNAGEAVALLTGGGGGRFDPARDAANFAANLTAGLLAVSARRKFGNWVPMLAVENNAQGTPSGARAGFDASDLIPKFMRGFARSMYVEGVVGARSDTTSRGVGVGVRVEVGLPRDFMTSMAYGPGTVWSVDGYWSP
jgi:TamB, inner membrane protein subunit of TAM complex